MKICFDTFGCRLNRAEALQMEAEYLNKGWELTKKHSEADLIVVRGCSVTRRAESDCHHHIAHLHKHYPNTPVRVCGCIEDKSHFKGAIISSVKTPSVHTPLMRKLPSAPTDAKVIPTRTSRAYLKVQDGCSGTCTFCIVPKYRGKSQSVPFTEVLDKARRFIEVGYRELVLTGCNLSLYASEGHRFPDLLNALAELCANTPPFNARLRIGSLEPGACALETVDVMAEHQNICRFLHLPIQSGANRVLGAMHRPYLVKDIETVVDQALAKMPLIGLGCDVIAGFPGEQEVEHLMTEGLLRRLPFSNVHAFPFSARPGTLAASFPHALSRDIRHQRAHALSKIGKESRISFAKRFLGAEVQLIIEDEKELTGWTGEYLACEITNKNRRELKRKELVTVRVTDLHGEKLKATIA